MNTTWNKFEAWLKNNWPDGFEDLNPPATEQEINQLQETLGVQLPVDFIACLRIHNGQKGMAGGLFDNSEFLSTQSIIEQWQIWKDLLDSGTFDEFSSEPESGVKNDWWNQKWIPITHNGGGDHFCIDLDPDAQGVSGQIITMWHDMANRDIQANSFKTWFNNYVSAVLDGRYVYSEDYGGLVDIADT